MKNLKDDTISITPLPKFRTQWDTSDPAQGCPVIGVSLTVPDESYSIRDILTKFTRMPDILNPNLVYDSDDGDDIDMDQDVITSFGDLTDFDMMSDRVNQLKEILESEKRSGKQKGNGSEESTTGETNPKDVSVV